MVGDIGYSTFNFFFSFILLVIFGYTTIYILKKTLSLKIWVWFFASITAFGILIFSAFFYLEYKKVINDRCYQQIDSNGCGGHYRNV